MVQSNNGTFKTHVILIDNRFEYDEETHDRLGDDQWEWLDKAFNEHFDADLTLLVAGVQVLRDNAVGEEAF